MFAELANTWRLNGLHDCQSAWPPRFGKHWGGFSHTGSLVRGVFLTKGIRPGKLQEYFTTFKTKRLAYCSILFNVPWQCDVFSLVPHAPSTGICFRLKRNFFSPFSKQKNASTRSVFESFSPIHTKTLKACAWCYFPRFGYLSSELENCKEIVQRCRSKDRNRVDLRQRARSCLFGGTDDEMMLLLNVAIEEDHGKCRLGIMPDKELRYSESFCSSLSLTILHLGLFFARRSRAVGWIQH